MTSRPSTTVGRSILATVATAAVLAALAVPVWAGGVVQMVSVSASGHDVRVGLHNPSGDARSVSVSVMVIQNDQTGSGSGVVVVPPGQTVIAPIHVDTVTDDITPFGPAASISASI
jgi:predicted phage tail protein